MYVVEVVYIEYVTIEIAELWLDINILNEQEKTELSWAP